ncbi:MAG: outer membrane beta-barrel protein, partial [Pseudomonadota bacterium]
MKIRMSVCAVFAMIVCAAPASAEGWEYELGYSFVGFDGVSDLNLGAVYGFAGYRWDFDNNVSGTFEGFLTSGVSDDTLFGSVDFSLKPSYGLAYRFDNQINRDFKIYGRALIASLTFEADGFGSSSDLDEWGFGLQAGVNFR